MYSINHIPIRSLGAIPCLNKQRIALEGVFDFPKRKGETEHNWGTGIEPFVEAEDLHFEGRNLILNAWLRGYTQPEYGRVLSDFKSACISCRCLSTGYAEFEALLKGEVKVTEYIGHDRARAVAIFWQESVVFPPLTTVPTGGSGYLIDGYNLLKDFGIRVSERKDGQNIGRRIEPETTLPYRRTEYRDSRTVTLRCYMRGEHFGDLYDRMGQFHALCAAPGLRVLRFPEGHTLSGYVADGFSPKAVHRTMLTFDFKLRVS